MAAELARTGRHVRISEDGLGARDAGAGNLSDDEAKPHEPIAKQNRHTIRAYLFSISFVFFSHRTVIFLSL
jgi:hypothetical protein